MKFPKVCKIHKATSKDAGRYAFTAVQFTGKELVATDGKILAIVPVTDVQPSEAPGLIGVDALTVATKGQARDRQEAAILANDKAEAPDAPGAPSFARPDGEFPKWQQILPAKVEGRYVVGMDLAYLTRLADALGTQKLVFSFDTTSPNNHVRIDAVGDNYMPTGAYGVLCTFKVADELTAPADAARDSRAGLGA